MVSPSHYFANKSDYNTIRNRLDNEVKFRRQLLQDMISQYLAAENMEMPEKKLSKWRRIIQDERDELEKIENQFTLVSL